MTGIVFVLFAATIGTVEYIRNPIQEVPEGYSEDVVEVVYETEVISWDEYQKRLESEK